MLRGESASDPDVAPWSPSSTGGVAVGVGADVGVGTGVAVGTGVGVGLEHASDTASRKKTAQDSSLNKEAPPYL